MPRISTYEIHCSEEEFNALKELVTRWRYELHNAEISIERELPASLQIDALEELRELRSISQHLCEAVGVE